MAAGLRVPSHFPRRKIQYRNTLKLPISWMMSTVTALNFITFLLLHIARGEDCSLPDTWSGSWFINELKNNPPTIVNSTINSISRHQINSRDELGRCVWSNGVLYIFKNPHLNCSKCILLDERHKNVLYSRETNGCTDDNEWDKENPESLCKDLLEFSDDEFRYFWFRKNYEPVSCPFGNSTFQFSYTRDDGLKCQNPVSHAKPCVDSTKIQLQYEACNYVSNSVAITEELTCIGSWNQSGYQHFVADVSSGPQLRKEGFRCFTYIQHITPNRLAGKPPIVTGYEVGTKNEATCIALEVEGPSAAATILYLTKENSTETECSFPTWLTAHNWTDMGKSVEFKLLLQSRNRSVHIHEIKRGKHGGFVGIDGILDGNKQQGKITFFPLSHSSLTCVHKRNMSLESNGDSTVAVIAKYTVGGCKMHEICLHLVQRSEYIFQIYYLENSEMDRDTLRETCFRTSRMEMQKGVTMVSTRGFRKACPNPGKYRQRDQQDSEWSIGCDGVTDVHTYSTENDINFKSFSCMDVWNKGNSTFTLVSSIPTQDEVGSLYCMESSKIAATVESEDVFLTSRDCIHLSEHNTLTKHDEIGSNGSPNLVPFNVQLYKKRNFDCNSNLVDINVDPSGNEDTIQVSVQKSKPGDSEDGQISACLSIYQKIPVLTLMFLTAIVLVLVL